MRGKDQTIMCIAIDVFRIRYYSWCVNESSCDIY